MAHALQTLLEKKPAAIGIIVGIDSGLSAETLARAGYDFLFIDQQHGTVDNAAMLSMVQAAQGADVIALVRPTWTEPAGVMRALDYGADGIIAPMIDTPEDAAELVSALRYPPDGKRSWGPIRAGLPDFPDYTAQANSAHAAIAMIETASAYENLDAILATPGLDGILIGPNDLSLALGCYGQPMIGDNKFADAVRDIAARATAAGILPGSHCGDVETAKGLIELGFKFVSVGSDLGMLFSTARQELAAFN